VVCHRYYADYDDLLEDANSDMPPSTGRVFWP
jgi:hypothetical protein